VTASEVDLVAQDALNRLASALVRHVDEVDARERAEHLPGEVGHIAGAGMGVIELAGMGLCVGEELLDGPGRE
jgi:hypothetical protein